MVRSMVSTLGNPRAAVKRLLTLGLVFVLLILALVWLTSGAALPDDGEPIAVSTDHAISFFQQSTEAFRGAGANRTISMTVTQEELTSFMSIGSRLTRLMEQSTTEEQVAELEGLAESGELQGLELLERWERLADEREAEGWRRLVPDDFKLELTIKEPEVRFLADGIVIVRGTGEWGFFSVPARVVAIPRVSNGRIEFDFVEGQLGRLGLSEALFDLVGDGLERVLLAGNDVAEVTVLEVSDGVMRFSARLAS